MSGISPERWRRLSGILDQLLELDDDRRAERLATLCGGDAELQEEVKSLLAAGGSRGLLDRPREEALEPLLAGLRSEAEPPELDRVGPWRVMRELGRGGMGVVYLAARADGAFEQRVALKVIKRGLDTDEVLARFRRERQILAHLEHPAIARLVDGGATNDGRPYLAIEHIEGEPITRFCDARRLAIDERLSLFRRVCDAVQYAHGNLVVHRDLKPSNILVTDAGAVKLLDFGIAKLLAPEEWGEATAWTRLGFLALTPEYAAPEQLRGETPTTATDVYALGVLLYELLTGRRPYRLPVGPTAEAVRIVMAAEPARPSTLVAAVVEAGGSTPEQLARARSSTTAGLRRRLAGDLDAIVLTALRREPERRYRTVQALADDLRRHSIGQTVTARPDSRRYRLGKFVRRHRVGVSIACAALLAAMTITAILVVQARRIARARDRAERVSGFLTELFEQAAPTRAMGREITVRQVLDRGVERIERELEQEPGLQSRLMVTMGEAYWDLGLYAKAGRLFEQVVESRKRSLGPDDPATLFSINRLANVYARQSRYEEALRLFRTAAAAQRRVLGVEHQDTLRSLNDLAFWSGAVGRYEAAERLHREVLRIRRRDLGPRHLDTLWTLHDLAIVQMRTGRLREAAAILRGVLESWSSSENPHVIRWSLAKVYLALERPGDAEALLHEALEYERRTFGADHDYSLSSARELAIAWRDQGRYRESEKLLIDTVERLRRTLGAENPETLLAMAALARLRAKQGRGEEAWRLLRETLEIQRRTLGARHPDFVASRFDMACVAALRGERAQAIAWLRRAVAAGWRNAEGMTREPDLESLRGDAEFQRLIAVAERSATRPASFARHAAGSEPP